MPLSNPLSKETHDVLHIFVNIYHYDVTFRLHLQSTDYHFMIVDLVPTAYVSYQCARTMCGIVIDTITVSLQGVLKDKMYSLKSWVSESFLKICDDKGDKRYPPTILLAVSYTIN